MSALQFDLRRVILLCALLLDAPSGALAQAKEVIPVFPVVDSARELKGRALTTALRAGGYVLYMRHAMQIPPFDGPCDKSNLTAEGEEQARKVGAAIRALKIPIGRLLTSEPCRNLDTARLLGLGEYEISADINPLGLRPGFDVTSARNARLMEMPPPGSNTLLVSHMHGAQDRREWVELELAEIIVYRPNGKTLTAPVARIRLETWEELQR
jgi:phosphohistidine phosphatase SixA